jgi:predicted nucleic acid-binding Zn ribbon protein
VTWRAAPTSFERDPQPVAVSFEAVLRSMGAPSPATMRVFSRWAELVGPQIATHAQPLGLTNGGLVVGVDQPAWATQLRFMSSAVLAKLIEGGAAKIDQIEVRVVGSYEARGPAPGADRPRSVLSVSDPKPKSASGRQRGPKTR